MIPMDILFLGSSAATPSRGGSTSCIAVREGMDIAILDCGEGSQRQLMISPLSFMKIKVILITHMHGDHVLGLPGLIQTMSLSGRTDPLTLCGPKGIGEFLEGVMTSTGGQVTYPLEILELDGGESFAVRGFNVESFKVDHGVTAIGYILRGPSRPGRLDRDKALELGVKDGPDMARLKAGESVGDVRPEDVIGPAIPGMTVAYTGDTRPCDSVRDAVKGVNVLIHEATYMESESSNAHEYYHTTALQAAKIASEAGVGSLIMTHVSHRYTNREALVTEAKTVFPESYVAEDMRMFEVLRNGLRQSDLRQA